MSGWRSRALSSKFILASRQSKLALRCHHQRIDFEKAHVLFGEGLVELAHHLHALLDLIAFELERGGDLRPMNCE